MRVNPNQVIATNLRRAREERGWSQAEAGRRLRDYRGIEWSRAVFSQAERGFVGGRARGFSVDEVIAFARLFGKPLAWFLMPPPATQAVEADDEPRAIPGSELVELVLRTDQLARRVAEVREALPPPTLRAIQAGAREFMEETLTQRIGDLLAAVRDASLKYAAGASELADPKDAEAFARYFVDRFADEAESETERLEREIGRDAERAAGIEPAGPARPGIVIIKERPEVASVNVV